MDMDEHDDELEEQARDLPESLWFDALGFVPPMLLVAYFVGTWLPPLL